MVLSSLLFILYTNLGRSVHQHRYILNFTDDSVIVSLLNDDEAEHGAGVDDFINWYSSFFLSINVSKTKDMISDFRKSKPTSASSTVILNIEVEIVSKYKYLGTVIDDKLRSEANKDWKSL